MRRHALLLCLLSLLMAGSAHADTPGQLDTRAEGAVGVVLGSALGAANPPNSGYVLLAFGLVPDDNDSDPVELRTIWTLTYLSAGTYDVVSGGHGATGKSVFAANLVILGSGYLLSCHVLKDGCDRRSQQQLSRGLYLAPLPRERGMELGYHWSFR